MGSNRPWDKQVWAEKGPHSLGVVAICTPCKATLDVLFCFLPSRNCAQLFFLLIDWPAHKLAMDLTVGRSIGRPVCWEGHKGIWPRVPGPHPRPTFLLVTNLYMGQIGGRDNKVQRSSRWSIHLHILRQVFKKEEIMTLHKYFTTNISMWNYSFKTQTL